MSVTGELPRVHQLEQARDQQPTLKQPSLEQSSAEQPSAEQPSADQADVWAARSAQLPGAELLLNPAKLSELLTRQVRITHLRIKPDHSVVVTFVDRCGAYGYAALTTDADKFTKAIQRAARVGETLHVHQDESPWLFSGPVWADPVLATALHSAFAATSQRFGEDGAHWEMLRYNPRRRVVAAVGPRGRPSHVVRVVESGAAKLLETTARWRELGVPVTNAKALGERDTAVITPMWGVGDLTHHPFEPAAHSAGSAVALLHSTTRLNTDNDDAAAGSRLQVLPVSATQAVAPIQRFAPWLGERAEKLAEVIERRLREAALGRREHAELLAPCELHGDLSADQVILAAPNSHKIRLIDLERSGIGHPLRDLGSWAATCFRQGLPQLVEPFLHGYATQLGISADELDLDLLSAWEAYSHLTGALDPFRHREQNWPQLITAAITCAEEAILR
ncbi:phosphotransferase family protein [Nesterenkonia massiliensis]|uniref:phosphotransferase family protein n=1 Tax=Nesterenkonia massiliensis TaxID=1232429 RepID=UPI00041FB21B|nr:phosphotransferase [Nesterenkonia massiliensis]